MANYNVDYLAIKLEVQSNQKNILFQIMIPPHQRKNFSEIYMKVDLDTLSTQVPTFDFSAYLTFLLRRPLNTDEKVVMYALPYFKRLTSLIEMTDKR